MSNVVVVTHWLDGDVIPFVRIGKENYPGDRIRKNNCNVRF